MLAETTGWPEPLETERDEDVLGYGGRAVFDKTRTYRYLLTRTWDFTGPCMTWIMLNPSTADAFADDPTIRRCISFARLQRCGSLNVVNLFALRATDPRELRKHPDPVGPCNDQFVETQSRGTLVVAAWGAGGVLNGRGREVASHLAAAKIPLYCLGVTAAGHPRHPLYVRGDAPLVSWEAA